MSIFSEIITILKPLNIPIETSIFSGKAPETYIILTPLSDSFPLFADNMPQAEICEVRLSLFSKQNYLQIKNEITRLLLNADFTITNRLYIGFEEDTKYHHVCIDIQTIIEMEEI